MNTTSIFNEYKIQQWMTQKLADELKVAADTIDINEPLTSFGIDSIAVFTLTGDLAEWLHRDLPATLLWEYPTIEELARYLSNGDAQ
jgi:acyl carrier protein